MKKKLMKLYKEWCETGRMPFDGLCTSLYNKAGANICEIFEKTFRDRGLFGYWGYELDGSWSANSQTTWYTFTPLRQTLMLLLIEIIDDEK